MNTLIISSKQIDELCNVLRKARHTFDTDRIKVILSLARGHSVAQIASILVIDESTVRNYQTLYQTAGIAKLLKKNYKGGVCRLSSKQIKQLTRELNTHIYLTTQAISHWIEKKFTITYTQSGLRDLLHRLNYVYKKPTLTPGNPDIEAQHLFAEQYEEFLENKQVDEKLLFLDAVHPEHNTLAAYGWLRRVETRKLKTNSGRQRLNLHGAMNAESYQVTVIGSETVNADSTTQLLMAIEAAYPCSKKIYIILDNAPYHYSKKIRKYLRGSRIQLVFLPTYSPNLNLIERLWKFFKKKVLYNKYHKELKAFRRACSRFFKHIDKHQNEIASLMSGGFELS